MAIITKNDLLIYIPLLVPSTGIPRNFVTLRCAYAATESITINAIKNVFFMLIFFVSPSCHKDVYLKPKAWNCNATIFSLKVVGNL